MVSAFIFFLFSLVIPAFIITVLLKGRGDRPFFIFPTALAIQLFFSGAFSALLIRFLLMDGLRYVIVMILSTVCTYLVASRMPRPRSLLGRQNLPWRPLIALAGLTLVCCADLGAIFSISGWNTETGQVYLRPPLHNDSYRNLVLVESLGRSGLSPFLPNANLLYQTIWHSLTRTFLFPFEAVSRYQFVSGATLATAVVFFFLLFWSLTIFRPKLFSKMGWPFLIIVFLVTSHADLYHFIGSLLFQGHPGIEADWSVSSRFFRMFSLKMVALSSPQHVFFLTLFTLYLVWRRLTQSNRFEFFLLAACYVTSPLLSLFSFPLVFVWDFWRSHQKVRYFFSRIFLILFSNVIFWVVSGRDPMSFFNRGDKQPITLFPWTPEVLAQIPLFLVATVGFLGIITSYLCVKRFQRFGKQAWNLDLVLLIGGAFIFLFLIDHSEVRRHYAMLAALVSTIICARQLPLTSKNNDLLKWRVPMLGGLLILHGYFLVCYLLKPSKVDPSIPWKDYFALNDKIAKEYSGIPILAAVDPWNLGLEMPLAMEKTTSFSLVEHAAIHSEVSSEKKILLNRVRDLRNVLPAAEALGFHLIIWGPVEERVWGKRGRDRFLASEAPLEVEGSVGLYRIEDRLLSSLHGDFNQGRAGYVKIANRLEEEGWDLEALTYFEKAQRLEPRNLQVGVSMAELFVKHSNPKEALRLADYLIGHHPQDAEPWVIKGKALRYLSGPAEALAAYRKASELNPRALGAYVAAVELLLETKEYLSAEMILKQGLSFAAGKSEEFNLLVFQATVLQSKGKFAEAISVLERAQLFARKDSQKNEVALRMGDIHYITRNLTTAMKLYESILDRSANDVLAMLRLGTLQLDLGYRQEALASMRAVLRRDYNNQPARQVLAMMGESVLW